MWKFCLYQDKGGKWRWRLCAKNRKVVADSAESYASKTNVIRAVRRFMAQIAGANRFTVEEVGAK